MPNALHSSHFSIASPLGMMEAEYEGAALVALRFVDDAMGLVYSRSLPCLPDDSELKVWLDDYFAGRCPQPKLALRMRGTPFQLRVWDALMEIPYGATVTYGAVAKHVGCQSARAVGQAVGHNPVALIVPCHRVVGAGGRLKGYAYGTERKQRLLQLEQTLRLA